MKLNFFKMQAQGNDYIYFDFLSQPAVDMDYSQLAIKLSDRHYGVGSDGIVLIEASETCHARMRIFNADGSEGKTCGSALRCLTSYLAKKTNKSEIRIETISGIYNGFVLNADKDKIKIDLGTPKTQAPDKVNIAGFDGYLVKIGNDHFVCFVSNLSAQLIREYGPQIQSDSHFPDSVNVDFVKINNSQEIEIKFWERGSGETLACGSGTAASVFAGIIYAGLAPKVNVKVPGGELEVEYQGQHIFLSGSVSYVFAGILDL